VFGYFWLVFILVIGKYFYSDVATSLAREACNNVYCSVLLLKITLNNLAASHCLRNWNLDYFNTPKLDGLVDGEDILNNELLKAYDIVGFLTQTADFICFAVMEVKGFIIIEGKRKVYHLSTKCSDLASAALEYTVFGQMIKLVPSEKQCGCWEWAKEYIIPSRTSNEQCSKKQSLTIEVPSQLIHPLNINIVSYPTEQSTEGNDKCMEYLISRA
jgi:hypothetical protein